MPKEPEREIKMLIESEEIPHLFFFPLFSHITVPKQAPWESVEAKTLREGNLTLHLMELRAHEDGQIPTASFPLPSCHLAPLWAQFIEVPDIAE